MASIKQYRSGWRAQVYVGGIRDSATFRTKTEAVYWGKHREQELRTLKAGTFSELLDRYIETHLDDRPKDVIRLNNIKNQIGDMPLSELVPDIFTRWRDERVKLVEGSSVRREMGILRACFQVAVDEWGMLPENPLAKVKRPADNPARERRISPAEVEELTTLLGYRPDIELVLVKQRVGAAFLFALETAMRAGEIASVCPKFRASPRVIHLPAWVNKNGFARSVPLSTRAIELLDQVGGNFNLTSMQISSNFRNAWKKTKIKDLNFHDTRHEAISRLASKLDILPLARMTGHRDLKMLLRYYHSSPEGDAEKLD